MLFLNFLCTRLALLKTAWASMELCTLFSLVIRLSGKSSPAFTLRPAGSRWPFTLVSALASSLHLLPHCHRHSPICPSSHQVLLSYSALYPPQFPRLVKLGFYITSIGCQWAWWLQSDQSSPMKACTLLPLTPQCFGWWSVSLSVSVIVLDNDTCLFYHGLSAALDRTFLEIKDYILLIILFLIASPSHKCMLNG